MTPVLPPSPSDSPVARPGARHATIARPPLLPAVFACPSAFLWFWVAPVAVMLAVNAQGYALVSGDMSGAQHSLAWRVGVAGVANLLLGIGQFVVTTFQRRRNSAESSSATRWRGLSLILVQVAYLWIITALADDLLPSSVTAWLYPTSRFLFNQYAFAMVPLFTGIVVLGCTPPPAGVLKPMALSLAAAIGAPVVLYLTFETVRFANAGGSVGIVIIPVVFVLAGIGMFIGVVRLLMLGVRAAHQNASWETTFVVAIALLLPLAGLRLNRSIPFPVDFQSWEVYALTVVNAAILLFGTRRAFGSPWLRYTLVCAGIPFSVYFFIVLLPFAPIAILAVMFGVGVLILTPTLLFTLHVSILRRCHHDLVRSGAHPRRVLLAGAAAALVLPVSLALRAFADRNALNAAVDYVATPEISASAIWFHGRPADVSRALASHHAYKDGLYYPLLSDFYSWVVFDNLILSDATLAKMDRVFLGTTSVMASANRLHGGVAGLRRTSIRTLTRHRMHQQLPHTAMISAATVTARPWGRNGLTTIALTLTNHGQIATEFETTFALPAGVFVSGFRMEVNGTMTTGRIFETKTAQWVYTQVRDERRDPGLLAFVGPREVELKAFPIAPQRTTHLEIDLLTSLRTDVTRLTRENDFGAIVRAIGAQMPASATATRAGVYLAIGHASAALPVANGTPYVHVIVDRSEGTGFTGDLGAALRTLQMTFPNTRGVRVTLANYDVIDLLPQLTSWGGAIAAAHRVDKTLPRTGGFAADLAVAHALRLHRDLDLDAPASTSSSPLRPTFILLTRQPVGTPLDLDIAREWLPLCPHFTVQQLTEANQLVTRWTLASVAAPMVRCGGSIRPLDASGGAIFAAPDTARQFEFWSPSDQRWRSLTNVTFARADDAWTRAAALEADAKAYAQNPAAGRGRLVSLVKASRDTGVLLPETSYIVVEREAQWRQLALSERRKLAQNAALEFQEAPCPSAIVVGALFVGFLVVRRRKRMLTVPNPAIRAC